LRWIPNEMIGSSDNLALSQGGIIIQSSIAQNWTSPSAGDRSALYAALLRRELSSQVVRIPCGSGFSREESNAVHGTGCAGVRG